MVQPVLLGGDGGLHHDPGATLQLLGGGPLAGQAAELDVVHAAGHHDPAGGEHAVLVPAEHGHLGLEPDGLALVLGRLLGDVPEPQGVVVVAHLNDGGVDVKGQGSSMSSNLVEPSATRKNTWKMPKPGRKMPKKN